MYCGITLQTQHEYIVLIDEILFELYSAVKFVKLTTWFCFESAIHRFHLEYKSPYKFKFYSLTKLTILSQSISIQKTEFVLSKCIECLTKNAVNIIRRQSSLEVHLQTIKIYYHYYESFVCG